eukprot:scaffold91537_cov20-Tisochrysis_lutea.AAC.1
MASMRPYSMDSWGDMKKSRSVSFAEVHAPILPIVLDLLSVLDFSRAFLGEAGQLITNLHAQVCLAPTHQVAIQSELVVQDLVGLDLDISGLALGSTQGLVDHDAGVGKAVALALWYRKHKRRQRTCGCKLHAHVQKSQAKVAQAK